MMTTNKTTANILNPQTDCKSFSSKQNQGQNHKTQLRLDFGEECFGFGFGSICFISDTTNAFRYLLLRFEKLDRTQSNDEQPFPTGKKRQL